MKNRTMLAAPAVLAVLVLVSLPAASKPVVRNLGAGLQEIASAAGRTKSLMSDRAGMKVVESRVSGVELAYPVVFDEKGRARVRITLDGKVPSELLVKQFGEMAGIEVTAADLRYRKGIVEAYVPPSSLLAIASLKGVLAVVPSSAMKTDVGKARTQGIAQHRINRIREFAGRGITVGVMSDSYDTNGSRPGAADDVMSGDLPGDDNPFGNQMPVVVLEDLPGGTDEGRAMLQIVHDIAPKARLGFATAATGEVGFANNIRALAGVPDAPNVTPDFRADVIVDDVIYPTEPMFQDGIIAQAVDQVAARGVSYFSSAGNRAATESYDSRLRVVPGDSNSWENTNLDFTGVDPALFAGGFHDFDSGPSVDIAQTIAFSSGSQIVFQWNEPYDPVPPAVVQVIASGTGTVPDGGDTSFSFSGSAAQLVEIFLDANPDGPNDPNPDLTFALIDPNGELIQFVDTTTNPESLILELQISGIYTVVVDSFTADQFGDFLYRVTEVQVAEQVLSDFNLLFFLEDGRFAGSSAEQNLFSNRPLETIFLPGLNLQMVVARRNVPPVGRRKSADRIRYVGFDGVEPLEYFSYVSSVTYGHNSARGAMGVAAYPFFRPFMPEFFTSPGPSTIYFDRDNRRLAKPEIRQKPDVAAMDGANTTFFFEDAGEDADTLPNFFGTSAAAPHAAAIGALVLEAAGGPGSVRPSRMRRILQRSAFPHDLDPHFSSGSVPAGRDMIMISAAGDQRRQSSEDKNFFTLWNGGKSLRSFVLSAASANPTGRPRGLVFDEREDLGLPFVIGTAKGVDPGSVRAVYSRPADPPGVAGQWKQLRLRFLEGFERNDLVAFATDRDEADAIGPAGAVGGASADLLGGGVLLPSGEILPEGARFFGTFEDGSAFEGRMRNVIGRGYSPLDGYGFINAEAAIEAVR